MTMMQAREWATEHVGVTLEVDGMDYELSRVRRSTAILVSGDGARPPRQMSVQTVVRLWVKENGGDAVSEVTR